MHDPIDWERYYVREKMKQTVGIWLPIPLEPSLQSVTTCILKKQALGTTWACEKFAEYILRMTITIETDHKLLVPLFSTKCLYYQMPPRVLQYHLRLNQFKFIIFIPWKDLHLANTLSRASIATLGVNSVVFTQEIESF